MHNERCFRLHMGVWLCEPRWLVTAAKAYRRDGATEYIVAVADQANSERAAYTLDSTGIATVELNGAMVKGSDKYGTDPVHARRSLRQATSNDQVSGIMLLIDSPGGTHAGTEELANEVRRANSVKPVHAHYDDLAASALVWVGSQARRVTANRSAEVGSIGSYAVVVDSSAAADQAGFKVHVLSTGRYKGAFEDGTEITPEQLEYVQGLVTAAGDQFMAEVARGRGLSLAAVRKFADGRVFPASEAKQLGLIDAVATQDEAYAALLKTITRKQSRTPLRDALENSLDNR